MDLKCRQWNLSKKNYYENRKSRSRNMNIKVKGYSKNRLYHLETHGDVFISVHGTLEELSKTAAILRDFEIKSLG